ncbi:BQ5605_C005g03666 [Microbotryum silenes-dioicae]|uniref:BQ5605_C005g03666 protein n=1 Tax=Microbotryum silenes-dioicae TaxID=796604 RepID=A0A2X0N5B5_9BASI|nr:BQ5605_C005g03666 [Microbotryum silenes-dioicae]
MARGRRKKWTPKAHAPPPISECEARLQSRRTRLQVLDLPGAVASPPAFSAPFPSEPTHIHKSSSKPHWKSSLEDVFEDVEPAGSSQRGFPDDVDATHSHSPVRLRRSINEVDLSPGSEKKLYEPQIRQRVDYSSLQSRRSMTSLQGDNPRSLDPPVPESRPHDETSDYCTVAAKVFCADLVQTAPVRDSPSSHQFSVATSICSSEESNTHESDDLLGHDDSALNMEGERVFNAQLRYRLTQLLNLSSEIPLGKIDLDFNDVTSSVTERLSPRPFKSILLVHRCEVPTIWPSPSKFRSATCGVTAYEYNGDLFLSLRDVFNGARNIFLWRGPHPRASPSSPTEAKHRTLDAGRSKLKPGLSR